MFECFRAKPPRRGFTLTEILIVIVIIGMLMALLLPAINAARTRAKEAVIKIDLSQLEAALEHYKDTYGDYPPDFFGVQDEFPDEIRKPARAAVLRHLRKAFPRIHVSSGPNAWDEFCDHFNNHHTPNFPANLRFQDLSPASALVFWLGGLPDASFDPSNNILSSKRLRGFSANPQHPFASEGSRRKKLFDFDETRLRGFDDDENVPPADRKWERWPMYSAANTKVPYVYFKSRHKEYAFDTSGDGSGPVHPFFCAFDESKHRLIDGAAQWAARQPTGTDANICVPYLRDVKGSDPSATISERMWNKEDSFQIIAPGVDEAFGNGGAANFRVSTLSDTFSENDGDYDNLTNFSEGRLEDGAD